MKSWKLYEQSALLYTQSLHAFIFRLYRPQQVDDVKGNNDLSSESCCLRTSVGAGWIYLLRLQIGDTIFSNFICPDKRAFGERESEHDDTRYERCRESGLFRFYSFVPFFSVFRSNIPREILYVIAIQPCVSGFRLTIASNYFRICVGRLYRKTTDGLEKKTRVWMKKYPEIGSKVTI